MDSERINYSFICSVYDLMIKASDKSVLEQVLEACVKEYDLSKACFVELSRDNHEISTTYVSEKEPLPELREMVFDLKDYDDGSGQLEYTVNDGIIICGDAEKESNGKIIDGFTRVCGAKSYLTCHVYKTMSYAGTIMYIDSEKNRTWDEEIVSTTKKLADIIFDFLVIRRREVVHEQLLNDFRTVAEEAKGIKDKFLSNMSHEIRTPLNAIVGMTTIMHHNSNDVTTLSPCIDKIEQASKQLLKLVNSCAEITLFDDSSSLLNNVWFTFEDIEAEINANNTHLVNGHNHTFTMDYPPDRQVCGDRQKLLSILNSLLHNSYRFTPNGGRISLKIESKATQTRRKMYSFTVKDNGVGMDEKFIPVLFDPFSKEISAQKIQSEGNGLGLGLALTKHLIDLMHGEIAVNSEKNKGTVVYFEVPLEEDEEIEYKPDNSDYEFTETYVGRRVLIAEDNALMAEIIMTLLGYKGLETDWASNGYEALDKFVSHDAFYYDIILMDLLMPVMDGYEATMQIRNSDKADASMIPIVALSAEAFDEAVEKSIQCGMNFHLTKPVGEKELMSVISRFVL